MTVYNAYYMDLLGYVLGLCIFIPLWVFLILSFQFLWGMGVMSVNSEYNILELLWTMLPSVMVGVLCWFNIMSSILPEMDEEFESVLISGHQWYWSYSVGGLEGAYDSVMLDFIDSVDKPLRLLLDGNYLFLVSSSDVIHSFSLPSLDLKMDGIPGRINEFVYVPNRLGSFVGYCSELCGAGHAYMPIVLEVVKGA